MVYCLIVARVTTSVEVRSTAKVYLPAGPPKLKGVRRFRLPGCPARVARQKHYRLADSVARWFPDPDKVSDYLR
ncbi:unnamed protein product [Strongylus vulgaris]|uniref:Uncharacterized protein n=1 Tax=Strongylus vulgaris TaxID=40348 RepID=A0A3P7JB75_STRVU|nr:unnamed protein product [Strongylus vulgaris]